jgi:hypothetical protein
MPTIVIQNPSRSVASSVCYYRLWQSCLIFCLAIFWKRIGWERKEILFLEELNFLFAPFTFVTSGMGGRQGKLYKVFLKEVLCVLVRRALNKWSSYCVLQENDATIFSHVAASVFPLSNHCRCFHGVFKWNPIFILYTPSPKMTSCSVV